MSHDPNRKPHALETEAVHGPHPERKGSVSTPLVHSATFTFDSLDAMVEQQRAGTAGSFYQRCGHPTIHATEERLAHLEGSEAALLFPSGMAAISSVFLSLLRVRGYFVETPEEVAASLREIESVGRGFDLFDLFDALRPKERSHGA